LKEDRKKDKIKISNDRIKNLKAFTKSSNLQKVALTAISVQASPDDIKELKDLFKQLDYNGDGSLSLEELKKGLKGKENGDALLEVL